MNTIKFTSAVSVDKGLIRGNNEDNFYFNGTFLHADERDVANTFSSKLSDELQIYCVFDGMGGEALGEEASLIAAQVMNETHKKIKASECDVEKEILDSVTDANSKICQKILESGSKRIGATFSSVVIENDKATVFNIGDSRVYMLRDGKLTQISVDDTVAQRLINIGVLSPEQAKTHKDRNKLTQHLGIFEDEMIIEPHVSKDIAIKKDDKFLLCSDGLTDMVTDEEICRILNQDKPCEQLCKELVETALKNGGKDNVTAIVVSAQTKQKNCMPLAKIIIPIAAVLIFASIYLSFSFMHKDNTEKKEQQNVVHAISICYSNPIENVKIGTEDKFDIVVEPANAKTEVVFSSSDPKVIEVEENTGFYKALSVGKATVTAAADGYSCKLEINVYQPVEDIIDIPEKVTLNIGETMELQYKLLPEGVDSKVDFVSEDDSIISVTDDGIITAHRAGSTNVIVSVYDYSKTIEISVAESNSEAEEEFNPTTTQKSQNEKNESADPVE